jgi:zinc D-Ala-D-Ala carboxypeptidase
MPKQWKRDARQLCADYLEPLRVKFGPVTIHSGLRSEGVNEEVGGAPESMHVYRSGRRGAAADLSCTRGTPADWYELLDELGCPGLGLYVDHVHADNRRGRARW